MPEDSNRQMINKTTEALQRNTAIRLSNEIKPNLLKLRLEEIEEEDLSFAVDIINFNRESSMLDTRKLTGFRKKYRV